MALKNLQYVLSGKDDGASKMFDKVGKAADGLGSKLKSIGGAGLGAAAAGGAVLGAGLLGGLMETFDVEKATDKLEAQIGAGSPLAASAGKIAGKLYADAYGESVAEAGEAVRQVLMNGLVNEDDTDAMIESVTGRLLDVSAAFDQDFTATAAAVGQMLKNGLAPDAEAALDIITRGIQENADKAGDLMDTFTEYGTQFRELGLSGVEATGLLSQGLKGGARDADTVADALKEFAIIAQDGSDTAAEGFKTIGLDAKKMTKAVASGGPGAKKALTQVLDGLRKIEDPAKRNAAAVQLFGTKAEDLQDALFRLDPSKAADGLGEVAGAAERAGTALNDNAATKIETFKRRVKLALVDFLGDEVIPRVEKFAEEFQKGTGDGGAFKQGLVDVGEAARDLAPHLKTAFDRTKTIVDFVIEHKDAFATIAVGVAAYATAMKAAAIGTAAMALAGPGAAAGITATGVAASGAMAVGFGAYAAAIGVGAAGAYGWLSAINKANDSASSQANAAAGQPTATIKRPAKPGRTTAYPFPTDANSSYGDDRRGVNRGSTRLVVNNQLNLDGKVVAKSTTDVQRTRTRNGATPAFAP